MTNTKWLVAVATLFLGCTLWCGVCEGSYLAGTDVASKFRILITWPGIWGILKWFENAWGMLWFDYSFFHGDWLIVRLVFMCISVGLVVSYGALLLPYLISGLRTIFGGIAGIFTGGAA